MELVIDLTDDEPEGFDELPVGDYLSIVTESEVKKTKAGNGTGLSLRHEIVEGPFAGRQFFNWINVQHENDKAEKIGRRILRSLCDAVNQPPTLKDSSVLHDFPVLVKLGKRKDGQGVQVKSYKAVSSAVTAPTPPTKKEVESKKVTEDPGQCRDVEPDWDSE